MGRFEAWDLGSEELRIRLLPDTTMTGSDGDEVKFE